MMKICSMCKKNKAILEFHKRKASRDGYNARCKVCKSVADEEYANKNKKKKQNNDRLYREKNEEKIKERKKKYYQENKKRILNKCRAYYQENSEIIKERVKKYRDNNRDTINTYFREYNKKKREENDVQYILAKNLRARINHVIKGKTKVGSALRDLGCSTDELKKHLESQFVIGMTWDNYGEWHIDHIIPLASFDLENREEFLQACHYTNLQPLWAKDNIRKGARLP